MADRVARSADQVRSPRAEGGGEQAGHLVAPRGAMLRRLLLLAGCIACSAPAPAPDDAAPGPRSLRVVSWNVHDLFDELDRTAPPGELDTVLMPGEVEEKLARVGSVLARLDADVVLLQEVENLPLLERLAAGPLAGAGYRAFLREGLDPRGIDVGLLARVPVESVLGHLDDRTPSGIHLWARDPLEVHLASGVRPVVLLGAHLVSRLQPADERRRLQAERLRQLADGLAAGATRPLVMVLGDLNDLPDSDALAPLLGDGALVDLGAMLPPSAAWTWSGGGATERLDYALIPRVERAAVNRFAVEKGPDVAAASDHCPLVVDLWLAGPG